MIGTSSVRTIIGAYFFLPLCAKIHTDLDIYWLMPSLPEISDDHFSTGKGELH